MTAASNSIDIQERLEMFLKRACPNINEHLQVEIAQEMKRSFSEWVLADEQDRGRVLETAQKRMVSILGISQEVLMEVQFSKAFVNGNEDAIHRAK